MTWGICAGLMAVAMPASAYVRYRSDSGCPYGWRVRTVPIREFPQGLAGLNEAEIANAATQAASAWGAGGSERLASCTDLDLQITPMTLDDIPPAAKYDQMNNVVFRSDSWCTDASSASVVACDPFSLAITSVFARKWGEILDADIEVNAVNFQWGDLVASPDDGGQTQDLQNALTHEMGHLIGLDHTCLSEIRPLRPVDQTGTPVLDCSDPALPESAREATMYASADPGDTSKRTLEADDEDAVCDSYPRQQPDPLACSAPDPGGGCGIASAGSSDGLAGTSQAGRRGGLAVIVGLAALILLARSLARRAR